MKDYSKGIIFCLIATVAWGILFPIMSVALERIDPFTFTSLRYLIAGAAFLAILLWREGKAALRLSGERVGLAWFFGTMGFAGFGFLVFLGQQMSGAKGALSASIMMAMQPMMGLLLNWIVRKTAPPKISFLFILLSFCGVAMVVSKGDPMAIVNEPQNFSADILMLLGALCWVIYTFGASYFPAWSPFKYTAITNMLGLSSIIAANVFMFAIGAVAVPSLGNVISIAPHLLYAALIAGLAAVLCWNVGNKILTPMNGVLFMDVIPVTTFIISAMSGVIPTHAEILGAGMTATALILNNIALRKNTVQTLQRVAVEIKQCTRVTVPKTYS